MTLTPDQRLRERFADRVTVARLRCDLLRRARPIIVTRARLLAAAERELAVHEDVWNALQEGALR